jgi:DNA-binding Xre family transcriptional regulator
MGHKHDLPTWCKDAKKVLIDRNMTVTDLAKAVGMTREHISSVINDKVRSPNTQKIICEHLGISASGA